MRYHNIYTVWTWDLSFQAPISPPFPKITDSRMFQITKPTNHVVFPILFCVSYRRHFYNRMLSNVHFTMTIIFKFTKQSSYFVLPCYIRCCMTQWGFLQLKHVIPKEHDLYEAKAADTAFGDSVRAKAFAKLSLLYELLRTNC